MPVDKSFIGRSYPATEPYPVSSAKIKEFADAIGDANPLCRDIAAAQAAGYPEVIAPPTFAMVVNIQIVQTIVQDRELGVDYGRLVHADQAFTHHRPIVAGDRLVLHTYLDDIMSRAGNDMLTVRGEITTEAGEPVSTTRATLVIRGEEASA